MRTKYLCAIYTCLILLVAFSWYGVYKSSSYNTLKELYYAELERSRQLEDKLIAAMDRPTVVINEVAVPTDTTEEEPQTLSAKNNNPLNVKKLSGNQQWRGEESYDKFNHVVFSNPAFGIRAGALVLMSYYKRHKLDTLEGIVNRFCTSNDKQAYVKFLSKHMGIAGNEKFVVISEKLPILLRAMTRYESGKWYPEEMFIPYDTLAVAHAWGAGEKR